MWPWVAEGCPHGVLQHALQGWAQRIAGLEANTLKKRLRVHQPSLLAPIHICHNVMLALKGALVFCFFSFVRSRGEGYRG